jgi:hypothetical protein
MIELESLWEKRCFAIVLQFNFWVTMTTRNPPYFYIANVIKQVAIVATHHICGAIHCNSIATLSKQLIFNYYATPLQLQP